MKNIVKVFMLIYILTNLLYANNHKMFQTVNKNQATLVKSGSTKNFCSICGMHLTKFYKTNYVSTFKDGHKEQYCSLHCTASDYIKNKNKIEKIEVVDTNSLKLIDTKKAFFVVGSSQKGTMSQVSKYAFSSNNEALEFQKKFGGEIYNFNQALEIALKSLPKDNMMIDKKREKVAKKGKKIYNKMCKDKKFQKFSNITEAKKYIIENKLCKNLKPKMLQAVAIYLYNPNLPKNKIETIKAPKDAKCPVCGMFVSKYPQWLAKISLNNKKSFYFDGVKDMMKFYFNPEKFNKKTKKDNIDSIFVTDYYTLKSIKAKKAFYVIGSNIYGPMGEELIPFNTKKSAKKFLDDHFGKKILNFDEIKISHLY